MYMPTHLPEVQEEDVEMKGSILDNKFILQIPGGVNLGGEMSLVRYRSGRMELRVGGSAYELGEGVQ